MIEAVLVTGAVGVGKTAVAVAAGDILQQRGLPAAVVDLDWLGWVMGSKIPVAELIARNLEAILPNFAEARIDYLILTRAMETETDAMSIRSALGDIPLKIVILSASEATIESRLRARDTGATLEQHLIQANAMSAFFERFEGDATIENEASPEATAAAVIDFLGWS